MSPSASESQALHIIRIPGECGPILRCSGELTVATTEALRRQVELLAALDHPAMILNVASCRRIDADGVMLLLDVYKRLGLRGKRFAVVTGANPAVRFMRLLDLEWFIPTFPSEEVAQRALRGGGPSEPAPATWEAARAASVAKWRLILGMLEQNTPEEAMREMTSMHGLCRHADEAQRNKDAQEAVRCQVCPLFAALGAHEADIGCQSAIQPMLEALMAGDREAARDKVAAFLTTIEQMPVPG